MNDSTRLDSLVILTCYFAGLGAAFALGICVGILGWACP
jgi:hypothetical protein